MTVSVTMLQTRMGEDGNLWTVEGSPYDASLDFAYYLIGNNFATGTLPTSVQSYPMTQVVATAAEIAAITGQPGVRYVERDGDKREFRWVDGFMVEVGSTLPGDAGVLPPGSYGDIVATGSPTTGLNISSSVLTAAARTVTDDASVADMVNTLGGATSTGSGGLVRATSPTLVTPILGTPQSITLTNGTNLPISTGVSGMAAGVATFLATPSSANLRTAVTDETGSGALVFATSPTLVTPNLGTPSAINLANGTGLPVAGITGLTTVATDVIFDAAGDLVVGAGANTSARLAIGATGNILRSNGTTAAWAALAAADVSIADAGSHFAGTSVEAALQELGARGGAAGGDDATAWGGFTGGTSGTMPTTVTVNGVTWTIGYTGNNVTSYTIPLTGAPAIVTAINYDNGYSEASGDILRGAAVTMTTAQARYLASEVLASAGALANGFRARVTNLAAVTDSAGSTTNPTCVLEWSLDQWVPVTPIKIETFQLATHAALSNSGTMRTLTFPAGIFGKRNRIYVGSDLNSTIAGSAATVTQIIKMNTTTVGSQIGGSGGSPSATGETWVQGNNSASAQISPAPGAIIYGGTTVTSSVALSHSINTDTTDLSITYEVTIAGTTAPTVTLRHAWIRFEAA